METEDLSTLPASGDHGSNKCHDPSDGPIDRQPSNFEHKENKLDGDNLLPEDDSDMEIEDLDALPASIDSGCGTENNGVRTSDYRPGECNSQVSSSPERQIKLNSENLSDNGGNICFEKRHSVLEGNLNKNVVDEPPIMQVSVGLSEGVTVAEKLNSFNAEVHAENGCLAVKDESLIGTHKMDGKSILGAKRARMMHDEMEPSVYVVYNSLTRASRQKLEELLQQWSQWHAQDGSSSQDPNEVLESGEKTFFPALHVGVENKSAVSFWMDNQTGKQQNQEFIPLDGNKVPLYDRGYALGLTSAEGSSNVEERLELICDASRCFNCGSYNHSLKECPKPRDNVAVNNARKQHKSKRNQNASSRNPTRYYQDTPGGKYDGLRPGALNSETRQLLGLGELDPPPWLNRMREIGYPPGYLDPDDGNQPSGITIYADGEIKEEQEDGEIVETEYAEPPKKMTVEFPGVNAPIPENADERLWGAGPSSSEHFRNRLHARSNHYSEPVSRGHHREQRRFRDFTDDGPPGCEPGYSPSISSYSPRYVGYDSSYDSHASRSSIPRSRSPTSGRTLSDRSRRSPLFDEGPLNYDSSRWDYRSGRYEQWTDESRNEYNRRDIQDRHYYHGRR